VLVVAAVLGTLGGALTPLLAYRLSVHYGAPSRSSCAGCAAPLPAGLPGWVRPRAACPRCGARWGPPVWACAAAGALVCAALAWRLSGALLVAWLVVALVALPLAAIDLACLRLPDLLVVPAGLAVLVLVVVFGPASRAVLAAGVLGGGYLVLALLPRSGLGYGDVKLAALLGLALGWLGWRHVLTGAVLPYVFAAPVALVLVCSRRLRRDGALPFGPYLLAGALIAALL
jgi:leader peptidase (prepilin peptidase) / N-methyltransferase